MHPHVEIVNADGGEVVEEEEQVPSEERVLVLPSAFRNHFH